MRTPSISGPLKSKKVRRHWPLSSKERVPRCRCRGERFWLLKRRISLLPKQTLRGLYSMLRCLLPVSAALYVVDSIDILYVYCAPRISLEFYLVGRLGHLKWPQESAVRDRRIKPANERHCFAVKTKATKSNRLLPLLQYLRFKVSD
jgi:hypothetical protein